ncbi:MAG: hypothetical protein Q9220_002653 [cf. Caloplaca sp. 1 TL-2023]
MRLLHTKTLEFDEFFDQGLPRYVILSHRWGEDEATFQDFEKGTQRKRKGYRKIEVFCKMAQQQGNYDWVWVDTCCIDKKSSAELSEAINSMFEWYKRANHCFVYLSDVALKKDERPEAFWKKFRKSAWFTRGWTLQELLAPDHISFYDQNWGLIGIKESLAYIISEITGINELYLYTPKKVPAGQGPSTPAGSSPALPLNRASVATRMSWASGRQTSRTEDMAYCLLGLFDVNMPLLYGEGKKAFVRLQEQIIKHHPDESIFAWASNRWTQHLFAEWPRDFARSRNVEETYIATWRRAPYVMTNRGVDFPVASRFWNEERKELQIVLNCAIWVKGTYRYIILKFAPPDRSSYVWRRTNCQTLDTSDLEAEYSKHAWFCPESSLRDGNSSWAVVDSAEEDKPVETLTPSEQTQYNLRSIVVHV